MEVPIRVKYNSLAEYQSSTKVLKERELFAIKGYGLRMAKEEGPANSVPYEEFVTTEAAKRIAGTQPGIREGYLFFVAAEVGAIVLTLKHDGTGGATGVRYSVNGGDSVLVEAAADTTFDISVHITNGNPSSIAVWPSYAVNGSVKGNITYLRVLYENLLSLNVLGLSQLETLHCLNNDLTSLDVSGLTKLKELNCGSNQLESLDVSFCTELEELYCYGNKIKNLYLEGCNNLKVLQCYDNQIRELDVSNFSQLINLRVNNNLIKQLDISGLVLLQYLDCNNNPIVQETLNFTGMSVLETVNLYGINLTTIDMTDCTSLKYLDCNNMTSLTSAQIPGGSYEDVDFSGCYNLTSLTVGADFDTAGGYYYHVGYPWGSSLGLKLWDTNLSGSVLDAIYQNLVETPTPHPYMFYNMAGYIYLKSPKHDGTTMLENNTAQQVRDAGFFPPCTGWDSDDPSLAPVAWTIFGT
jgi:hypothetical protein